MNLQPLNVKLLSRSHAGGRLEPHCVFSFLGTYDAIKDYTLYELWQLWSILCIVGPYYGWTQHAIYGLGYGPASVLIWDPLPLGLPEMLRVAHIPHLIMTIISIILNLPHTKAKRHPNILSSSPTSPIDRALCRSRGSLYIKGLLGGPATGDSFNPKDTNRP